MILKGFLEEDFSSYKKPSMLLAFPKCSFKCGSFCQNIPLAKAKDVEYDIRDIINKYLSNCITESVIFAGLEPMDSFSDILEFIDEFRKVSNDEIVVYTGFDESEIYDKITLLSQYKNVIMKFGRFIPNQEPHYDETLGVNLASNNQYARRIS